MDTHLPLDDRHTASQILDIQVVLYHLRDIEQTRKAKEPQEV